MPLLTIEPNLDSREAHKWLLDVFLQILERIEIEEETADNLTCEVELLPFADTDIIFEKAIRGLLA